MEEWLSEKIYEGKVEEVKEILRDHRTIDVNRRDTSPFSRTYLYQACLDGQDSVVALLLAHPDIDVNLKTQGSTPFLGACAYGGTASVRLLLRDSRVEVNEADFDGYTPLWYAAYYGYFDLIQWWIASGRDINLGEPRNVFTDAVGIARDKEKSEVVALLERFKENPEETRHEIRLKMGFYDELARELFALVVFVSDGLLQVAFGDQPSTPTARFFNLAAQLPLELQMVLCFRVAGSAKVNIPSNVIEVTFKDLVKSVNQ